MVLPWITYALALALLLAGSAAAAEKWLRLTGRQGRWAWLVAMSLSVGLPAAYLAARVVGLPAPDVVPPGWTPAILAEPLVASPLLASGSASPSLDAWFPWLWGVLSIGIAGWLAVSAWRLRDVCRSSPAERSGGELVVWTSGLGPGVVGVRRPRIVAPDWVKRLDGRHREMILLHEREHVRCRDPHLLHAGWALVTLVPWLLPLWWQFRRLREAVELDCDQRVVDRVGDAREYGRLLVQAKRLALARRSPLVTGGSSFLAHRVRRLADGRFRRPGSFARLAVTGVASVVALSAAVLLPPPGSASPTISGGEAADHEPRARESTLEDTWSQLERASFFDEPPRVLNAPEVRAALHARHREELRREGIGGEVLTVLHVDADGRVTGGFVSVSSGHEALDRIALDVASDLRYEAARHDGEPSAVWIGQPLRFPGE